MKDALREAGRNKVFEVLTKKPVIAGEEEEEKPRGREVQSCGRQAKFDLSYLVLNG